MRTYRTLGLVGIAALSAVGFAQRGPNLSVQVRDNYGRPLSDAKITLVGPEKYDFRTYNATTNRDGYATLRPNMSGRYVVFVTRDDFALQNRDINISDSQPTNADFKLSPTNNPKILVFVRSDDTNEGISGANVLVRVGNSGEERRYSTRSGGYATIPVEYDPYARYSIDVSHRDFQPSMAIVQSRSRGDRLAVLHLRRETSDRIVVIRALDSRTRQPIRNARVTFENGRDRRTEKTNSEGIVSVRLPQRATYTVSVDGESYHSMTDRIDLNRVDSSTYTKTFELRAGNGGPIPGGPGQYQRGAKVGGDIRLKKSHYKLGEVVTVDLGVFYSDYAIERLPATVNVQIYGPSGRSVYSNNFRMDLSLNSYTRKDLEVDRLEPGNYTIRATAGGNEMRSWSGEKTFTVDRDNVRVMPEGIYNGKIDLVTLSGTTRSHSVSLKVTKKNGNLYDVVGSLGPGREEGFHIEFKGTYDVGRKSLRGFGEMAESNRRYDIKVSGGLDNAGKMEFEISIRGLDNKYDRSAHTELKKN